MTGETPRSAEIAGSSADPVAAATASAAPGSATAGHDRLGILAIVAALLLFCLPLLSDVSLYHSDERYYTDSAIHMVQSGDWTTPVYLGEPRLKKPMLTYWLTASSFEVFGIGLFAARLPSLLLGCLLAWATWRTALALLGDREIGLLSAALVASLWPIASLACRTTPDIAVTAFTALSLCGFARILFARERSFAAAACAWGGAGLAVASKGGLGIAVAAWAILFALLSARKAESTSTAGAPRMRDLFQPVAVLLGLAAAAAGFAWAFLGPGESAGGTLLDDQVATKLARSVAEIGDNLWTYGSCVVRHFLPWTVLVAIVVWRERRVLGAFVRSTRAAHVFALGWSALVVIVFSLANAQRARYLAPAYPTIAIVVAACLVLAARRGRSAALLRRCASAILLVLALVGLLVAAAGARVDSRFLVGGLLLALVGAGARHVARTLPDAARLALVAGALLAAAAIGEEFFRQALDPSPSTEIAARLARSSDARCASLGLDHRYSAQVLAISGGRVEMASLPDAATDADLDPFAIVVVTARHAARLAEGPFDLELCGFELSGFRARDVWELVTSRDPSDVIARRKQPFYVAVRRAGG